MTVSTLRPNADLLTSGLTLTGAASFHAALADDGDGSYVSGFVGTSTVAIVGFADLTLPAGAVIKRCALRLRTGIDYTRGNDGPLLYFQVGAPFTATTRSGRVAGSPTTTIWASLDAAMSDSQADGFELELSGGISATGAVVYEAYVDITYVNQPSVTVSGLPSTVTDTNEPTVLWTDTLDSDGGAQTNFEVKIFDSVTYSARGFDPATAVPGAQSGITASNATSWKATSTLPDATYRAYVRVAQTVNGIPTWSAWAYQQFGLSIVLPAVPALTLSAEPGFGRVRLDATHNSGSATTDAIEFQYSTDGGTTWSGVRTADGDGLALSADATAYDFESGNGQIVSYRARALHNYSGVYAASAWATVTGGWTSTDWWLKNPLRPDLSMVVVPMSQPSITRTARQGIFQALGARRPVVVADTRSSDTGTIVLRLDTATEQTLLDTLLEQGGVILLQAPPEAFWTDRYIAFGDLNRERLIDKAWSEPTLDTLTWVEGDRPAGALLSVPA